MKKVLRKIGEFLGMIVTAITEYFEDVVAIGTAGFKKVPGLRNISHLSLSAKRCLVGYIFILPWFFGFVRYVGYPLIRSFIISFQTVESLLGFKMKWVGLQNYAEAFFVDERFVPMLLEEIRDTVLDVPVILVFSIFVSYLVCKPIRFVGVFRAIFFLPVVVASGLVVKQLFDQGVGSTIGVSAFIGNLGVADMVFTYFGANAATYFLDLLNRMTLVLWRSGVQILLFIAGFQSIGSSYYEAARVDGANEWEMFWKISLPMVSPIILVNIIYSIVDSFTDVFNQMIDFIKNIAFTGQFRLGLAAAFGWVYFVVIFLLILIVLASSRKWVFYGGERD
ncbi:MAG: sugar ABC transporter permease [Limnochordia bacterium]|jgi:ABC-type sugar transport system permease subunit|nr:sugar ABC transporter permease [Limnochordia bacterium]